MLPLKYCVEFDNRVIEDKLMAKKWTEQEKLNIWARGDVSIPNDPKVWRRDFCGAWIKWSDYGNHDSEYGWEIDYIKSDTNDGLNLRPLHWRNNFDKRDGKLKCNIMADRDHNIDMLKKKHTK